MTTEGEVLTKYRSMTSHLQDQDRKKKQGEEVPERGGGKQWKEGDRE